MDLKQTQEKFFKPVTENLKELASIAHEPKAIAFKSFPSITAYAHEEQQPQVAEPNIIAGIISYYNGKIYKDKYEFGLKKMGLI